jgi:acetoin utilization protein AcuB
MIAAELINQMIPPLKPTDIASKAISWMEEMRIAEIPVLENGKFVGFISEDIILESNNAELEIKNFPLIGEDCWVRDDVHFYNVLKKASEHHVKMVAVMNNLNEYEGVITIEDTITAFAQSASVQSPGAILVLSMNQIDYSLSAISRLIEENEAKVLSCCVTDDNLDASKIKLTLKINKTNLSHIIATLERFGYKIIGRFQDTVSESDDKGRWDLLMKYLSI